MFVSVQVERGDGGNCRQTGHQLDLSLINPILGDRREMAGDRVRGERVHLDSHVITHLLAPATRRADTRAPEGQSLRDETTCEWREGDWRTSIG